MELPGIVNGLDFAEEKIEAPEVLIEGILHRGPTRIDLLAATQFFGDGHENIEVGFRFTGRLHCLVDLAHAAFGICVSSFFFSPHRGRKNKMGN